MSNIDFFYLNHQSQLEPLKITATRAYHKFLSIKQESPSDQLKYPVISKVPYGKYQRPYYFLDNGHQSRHYFWGEGQNYTNNLEIFFDDATIHIDKFFSKARNDAITLKIFRTNNKIIKFKPTNQFKLMFKQILKNYEKNKFKKLNYSLIRKQTLLLDKLNK